PSASSPPATSAGIQQNLKGNWRASKLVGLSVYNDANENLGSISEILVDNTGKINAVVIGVGGFLGVGQHDIAVSFDKLKWVNEPIRAASNDRAPAAPGMSPSSTATPSTTTTGAAGGGMAAASATKDNWYPDHAVMSGTKEQLKALPAFKYSDYN
ncbi:MAG: PRC-barrel domain-containing protein, partial [Afipia sp.]|nr:PRC-barrel domain-containing protein [Afipia sp.]